MCLIYGNQCSLALISFTNSVLVSFFSNSPQNADVVVTEFCFCTPRIIMHKCNNPNYHGHNYELIIKITGVPDIATGYVYDMKLLSDLIQTSVLERFDHKNLNEDTVEFKNLNPSAENIAIVIYNILREKIEEKYALQIRLYETERNFVEYPVN